MQLKSPNKLPNLTSKLCVLLEGYTLCLPDMHTCELKHVELMVSLSETARESGIFTSSRTRMSHLIASTCHKLSCHVF